MPGPRLCYTTHQRATSAHCKRGGLPPSLAPLGHNDSLHPVGAGHARPAALRQLPVSFCIPFIFYIVGRGCGVANRGVSNVCPCGANNRTSVFAKQTGGARCAPPSVDPSAASRQIPSMFRPQRENSSPHRPPPAAAILPTKKPAPSESHFGRGWLTDLYTLL